MSTDGPTSVTRRNVAQSIPLGEQQLARRMNLPLLILYGLSVTIGAGIYVLIGEVAARAGSYTPLAFIGASVLVAFSAASYSELSARFPVSAGEAAYVRAGLDSPSIALIVGLMVALTGIVSSATILRGGAGYVQEFISAPIWLIALIAGTIIAAITAWGIGQAAWTAAVLGVCEVGLLVFLIILGLSDPAPVGIALDRMSEAPSAAQIAGLSGSVLIAFFAYVGFEDLVNVAEEVEDPVRNLPLAIAATLILSTLIYFLIALVALAHLPLAELSSSGAPLTLLYQKLTHSVATSHAVTLVAIAAVMNGVLVQLVMVSRVLYGLSRMGQLPEFLGRISPSTRTPIQATAVATVLVLLLCLSSGTPTLAEMTSTITLLVFAMINLSLWRIKVTNKAELPSRTAVPLWVPACGFVVSTGFLAYECAARLGLL